MAWYPGAERMELQPESDDQPAIVPTQLIAHSIAAPWTPQRIFEYWRDSTNLESHFGLGYDGAIAQYIGTQTKADANMYANRRPDGTGAVSIETASNLQHTDPWTPEQVEALIRLGVWLHQQHGIPLRICRSWDDPGYGYHRLFAEWSDGGTACPGDARVQQFKDRVFPGIVARASGQLPPAPNASQEDDMPTPQEYAAAVWDQPLVDVATGKKVTPGTVLAWMDKVHNTQVEILGRQNAATTAAITALATQLAQVHGVDTATVVAAVQQAIADAVLDVNVSVTSTPKGN
ncbi:N-acetylmuramoyl-L-alanine amidase [Streptomyces sp. CB03911]|uniref:peptidoglycan recognition protein family protein n=1 Tax=Streptomyces sp. CB03911 TaxID=1804758 RepID=UPI0009A1256E|nr:N-acetylmuramoyl-L-alanine amidase [Streptomyces sp. CB03911]